MLTCKQKKILREVQGNFPLHKTPWRIMAGKIGITEKEMINEARKLKRDGIIRYVGIIYDNSWHKETSTLVAMKVAENDIPRTTAVINRYGQVTHNYLRDGDYNIWFTLTAPSRKILSRILEEIKEKTGNKTALDLRTEKRFKVKAIFDI